MLKSLAPLIQQIRAIPASEALRRTIRESREVEVNGAVGSLRAILLALLLQDLDRPILWIFESQDAATHFKEDLEHLIPIKQSALFPQSRKSRWGHDDLTVVSQQAEILEALTNREAKVYLASYAALWAPLRKPEAMQSQVLRLGVGKEIAFDRVLQQLSDMGFEREYTAEKPGDMAARGGIIDVYPFSAPHPVRIEFWGNQIESLREFDPASQRSTRQIASVTILPKPNLDADSSTATLLDYLPDDALVVYNDFPAIEKQYSGEQNGRQLGGDLADQFELHSPERWHAFQKRLQPLRILYFSPIKCLEAVPTVHFHARHLPPQNGDVKALIKQFRKNTVEHNGTNYFLCESRGHALRMWELFLDRGLDEHEVRLSGLSLSEGFLLPDQGIFVYTDHQFYGRIRRQKVRRKQWHGLTLRQLKTLSMGDFVVHEDYGIGVFRGLEKIRVRGHERECLLLEYRDGDKLYVPLDRMNRVQKYSGRDGYVPTVSKLGSPEWERVKNRTKSKVRQIAKELVQLYALRKTEKGFAFSPDTTWQKELEASFMYEDTPDQSRAVREVKKDMESDHPMDRLVCGDVGYGKTEVAIRAAFKAVQDGKQVAVLVPTTILAEQHYFTFKERLKKFPVNVDVLSRFRSPKEQKRVVEQLKQGEVDIVIGTHRLLSKDVEFKDLGLLVIDEEQRFGVRHKERLKQLRVNVDVLTLSATPIPRTLQMSLLGVRDMSPIHTPPRDRLPIHTEIMHFDRKRIREAILREVERGGQVFFVHNRVESIYRVAQQLAELVPEVEVAVAHGQMKEKDLEKVMWDFMHRHYHVLVTTMIIESGLDMPNVNTIFINRADRFGLAQLYQLRGRVGRSNVKAYCYLIVPPIQKLTPEAVRRLETIEEYTDLGSGMQIALRDLEIRGAGSLLGAEQSGFIDAMGYDTYMKILEEAIKELKREELPEEEHEDRWLPDECKVDVAADAYLPQKYAAHASDRVDIYRRIAHAREYEQVQFIEDEVKDRFGRLPEEAENLFLLAKARLLGRQVGLSTIRVDDQLMVGYFAEKLYNQNHQHVKEMLARVVHRTRQSVEFAQQKTLVIKIRLDESARPLKQVVNLLKTWLTPDGDTGLGSAKPELVDESSK
ncbi:MAG: transcription-repair coupling factor [candidate division KSB1 bacterium]|nr:transcription-repair coupling factor [candidate division KSB1 bacterium]